MAAAPSELSGLAGKYEADGFVVLPGLFEANETSNLLNHFTHLIEKEGGGGFAEHPIETENPDPLRHYPRLLHPHRRDSLALGYMLDSRIGNIWRNLLGETPLAVQTMVYFKPPGSRGQALHQDNRYLKASPGTCCGAWMALEDVDEGNGCLFVVPGSHKFPILCPGPADAAQSWTRDALTVPPGMKEIPVPMKAGDVLFFDGQLIHGSYPNVSPSRFRRIIAAHYVPADSESVAEFYHPVYRFDGSVVGTVGSTPYGDGPCGVMGDAGQVVDWSTIGAAKSAH